MDAAGPQGLELRGRALQRGGTELREGSKGCLLYSACMRTSVWDMSSSASWTPQLFIWAVARAVFMVSSCEG